MARQGTGKRVDAISHKATGEIPVFYLAKDGEFRAEVYGQSYRAKSKDELRSAVFAAIEKSANLTWLPAIEVTLDSAAYGFSGDANEPSVKIKYERFYWTYRPDGVLIRTIWSRDHNKPMRADSILRDARPWNWTTANRKGATFNPPCYNLDRYRDAEFYLVYSDDTWQGLGRLADAIRDIRKRVTDLLSTPAGHATLERAALNLLAAPVDKESTDGR